MQQYPYPVLLAEPEFGPGEATWAVAERLMARGLGVIPAQDTTGVTDTMNAGPDFGAALLGWNLFGSEREFHAVVDELSALAPRPPVVLLSETASEQSVPGSAAQRADGFFWLPADSPSYVAMQVERLVRSHAEELISQFLGELTGDLDPAAEWISYLPGPSGELAAAGDASRCLALPLPARGDLVPGGN